MKSVFVGALALAGLFATAPVSAQSVDANYKTCVEKSGEEAIKACTAAIDAGQTRLGPDRLATTYHNRGVEYATLKKYDLALQDYNTALGIRPVPIAVDYSERGFTYYMLSKYPEAVADLDKAIQMKPDDQSSYLTRGLANMSLGGNVVALWDMDHAVAMNPANEYAVKDQAMVRAALAKAAGVDPAATGLLSAIAACRWASGADSIRACTTAIQAGPAAMNAAFQANNFANRAAEYFNAKQYTSAVSDYEQALKLNPDIKGVSANLEKARAALAAQATAAAQAVAAAAQAEAARKAAAALQAKTEKEFQAKLKSGNAGQLFAMADDLKRQGQADQAHDVLRALVTRFPNSPLAGVAAQQMADGPGGSTATSSGRSSSGGTTATRVSSAAPSRSCQSILGDFAHAMNQMGVDNNDMQKAIWVSQGFTRIANAVPVCRSDAHQMQENQNNLNTLMSNCGQRGMDCNGSLKDGGVQQQAEAVIQRVIAENQSTAPAPPPSKSSGICKREMDKVGALISASTGQVNSSKGAKAIYMHSMWAFSITMQALDNYCKGEPDYEQYAGLKHSLEEAKKSCIQLSSDNGSSCVPTRMF